MNIYYRKNMYDEIKTKKSTFNRYKIKNLLIDFCNKIKITFV